MAELRIQIERTPEPPAAAATSTVLPIFTLEKRQQRQRREELQIAIQVLLKDRRRQDVEEADDFERRHLGRHQGRTKMLFWNFFWRL